MVQRYLTSTGNVVYRSTPTNLARLTAWARQRCHQTHGPLLGEQRFRQMPAKLVFEMWLTQFTASA